MEEYDDEMMSAEEFFGEISKPENVPAKTCRKRRKGASADLFQEAKLRMVMRINGVSRAKALEIIGQRAKNAETDGKHEGCTARPSRKDVRLMSPVDFFGEV